MWFRQLQRLLGCFVEFIDEDSTEAGRRAAVEGACSGVVVAWAGEGEQDFAGEAGGREHGGMAWEEPGEGWVNVAWQSQDEVMWTQEPEATYGSFAIPGLEQASVGPER